MEVGKMAHPRNALSASKYLLIFTSGLLIGIMMAFIPKVHAAYDERMGMMESTDHGATWHFKGHANFHSPALNPVDPSALFDNGLSVLYFFDLQSLSNDTAIVYRSVATDPSGLDFSPPAIAFKFAGDITDPFVLKLPESKYRMYVNGTNSILSATSKDGFTFALDEGERTRIGGVPGAIVLPGSKVRLFVCHKGITSLISANGHDFIEEPGVRIPVPLGAMVVADPSPIRCSDGKYRMAYKVRPAGQGENPQLDEVYLAESDDGLAWTAGSASIAIGSVPTLLELADGRLRIYYVDFQPDQPTTLFKYIQRVQVTPDSCFKTAAFVRIGHVPASNKLAVTFKGDFSRTIRKLDSGYAYKEYTLDLKPAGEFGALYKVGGDIGGLNAGNIFYAVDMVPEGWHIAKFDAVSWQNLVEFNFPLDSLREGNFDMMVSFVNGELDISSQTLTAGKPSPPELGASTHHHFFTPDLGFLRNRVLADTFHIAGSSMIYVDKKYYFVTASAYAGDVIVMEYDSNWKYLGSKKLISQAHWPEGLGYDGEHFYVSYLDARQRSHPAFFPYYPNVHLAAFDRDWNLVEDLSVTNYAPSDSLSPGRPSLLLLGNRLYVTYDVMPLPEDLNKIEGFINVYELAQSASSSVESNRKVTEGFRLKQNYPNPFNPVTTITFTLPSRQYATLKVYDILGREVAVLYSGVKDPGKHILTFNGKDLPAGEYFYKLQTIDYVETKKLIILK